jgi:hypothetical protein
VVCSGGRRFSQLKVCKHMNVGCPKDGYVLTNPLSAAGGPLCAPVCAFTSHNKLSKLFLGSHIVLIRWAQQAPCAATRGVNDL